MNRVFILIVILVGLSARADLISYSLKNCEATSRTKVVFPSGNGWYIEANCDYSSDAVGMPTVPVKKPGNFYCRATGPTAPTSMACYRDNSLSRDDLDHVKTVADGKDWPSRQVAPSSPSNRPSKCLELAQGQGVYRGQRVCVEDVVCDYGIAMLHKAFLCKVNAQTHRCPSNLDCLDDPTPIKLSEIALDHPLTECTAVDLGGGTRTAPQMGKARQ